MDTILFNKLIKYYKDTREEASAYLARVYSENDDAFRVTKCLENPNYNLHIKNMNEFVRLLIAAKSINIPYINEAYYNFINSPQVDKYLKENHNAQLILNYLDNNPKYTTIYFHQDSPLEQESKEVQTLYNNFDLQSSIAIYNTLKEFLLKHKNITSQDLNFLLGRNITDAYQKQLMSFVNILKKTLRIYAK